MIITMKYYAFIYRYQPDSSLVIDTRPEHREFIRGLHSAGRILGSGPLVDAAGGALIIVQLDSDSSLDQALALMDQDPFYARGAIESRECREWNPVINSF